MTPTEKARALLMHAVDDVLSGCGNSYVNAYTERWLRGAAELEAYFGPFTGKVSDVKEEWSEIIEAQGGLPELP